MSDAAAPPAADPLGVPDLAVVVSMCVVVILWHCVQRHAISPRSRSYRALPVHVQHEWDWRAVNLLFHILQAAFNCYVLFFNAATRASPLYGYDTAAHAGFLAVLAYYLYDSVLIAVRDDPGLGAMWLLHHLFTVAMLAWLTAVRRTSALPASVFLVSAAGHVGNEARWFLRTTESVHVCAYNAVGVACNTLIFVTSIVPPPYMVLLAARRRRVAFLEMLFRRMRWPCIATFWLVWLVHALMLVAQVKRTVRHWDGNALKSKKTS